MAKNICQIITPEVSSRYIGKVTVPSGGLVAGNIVLADTLDNTIVGNYEVFTAQTPSTPKLGSNFFALVINGGVEELADGRRPEGQPDYTNYSYREGATAPVIFLEKHLMFEIGLDAVSTSTLAQAVVGNYLIPVNGSVQLSASPTIPDAVGTALKIVAKHNLPLGGLYGGQFASTLICTPVIDDVEDTGAFIYSFSLPNQVGSSIIDQENGTITAVVAGARGSMAASFSNSRDAVVKVGDTIQVSGTTTNNFTSPVTYTVTSESGESNTYVVTVSLETYDLTENDDPNTTLTVTRGGTPVTAGTDVLTYGDVLTISASAATGYETVITVNGETFTSGETLTVNEDVNIVTTTTLIPYTLSITGTGNETISVMKGDVALTNGAVINYGDILVISVTPSEGYTSTLTVNSESFTSGNSYSVIGDTAVVATSTPETPTAYTLTLIASEGVTLTVTRGADTLSNGATIYSGDVLNISATAIEGEPKIYVNDETYDNEPYTVTGDTTIEAISN